MNPEGKKLEDLSDRIRKAESDAAPKPREAEAKGDPVPVSRIGFDFVGAVGGAGLLGWLIDRQFGTAPWGVGGFVMAGFVVGFINVWRALQQPDNKE